MGRTVQDVLRDLKTFKPEEEEELNVGRLYEIFDGFQDLPGREQAGPAMFDLLERYPEAALGNPGPLVHELEQLPGVGRLLVESLGRRPTFTTVWMVNRFLNSPLPERDRARLLEELRKVLKHPQATAEIKADAQGFLDFQQGKK